MVAKVKKQTKKPADVIAADAIIKAVKNLCSSPRAVAVSSLRGVIKEIKDPKTLKPIIASVHRLYNTLSRMDTLHRIAKMSVISKKILRKKALQNFFAGLPKGWKLTVDKDSQDEWFSLVVPCRPFILSDKRLKAEFKNVSIRISGKKSGYLQGDLGSKSAKTVHKGQAHRIHPHASGSPPFALCLGEGTRPASLAADSWDIISYYKIFYSVLHNYKERSAYIKLDGFTDQIGCRCRKCKKWISKEEKDEKMEMCNQCKILYCLKCAETEICSTKPPAVKCYICKGNPKKEWGCRNCSQSRSYYIRCTICKKQACSNHSQGCQGCGDHSCHSCGVRCRDCGYNYCPNCVNERKRCGCCRRL